MQSDVCPLFGIQSSKVGGFAVSYQTLLRKLPLLKVYLQCHLFVADILDTELDFLRLLAFEHLLFKYTNVDV